MSLLIESLYVRFVNCNEKLVDIFWITYSGQFLLYTTLRPRQFVDVNTYTNHIWIFKEKETGTTLMANNKPCFCGIENDYSSMTNFHHKKRYVIYISKPLVRKLRSICINYVCQQLKRCTDVKYLEIPVTLKREIIRKIHCQDATSHVTEK